MYCSMSPMIARHSCIMVSITSMDFSSSSTSWKPWKMGLVDCMEITELNSGRGIKNRKLNEKNPDQQSHMTSSTNTKHNPGSVNSLPICSDHLRVAFCPQESSIITPPSCRQHCLTLFLMVLLLAPCLMARNTLFHHTWFQHWISFLSHQAENGSSYFPWQSEWVIHPITWLLVVMPIIWSWHSYAISALHLLHVDHYSSLNRLRTLHSTRSPKPKLPPATDQVALS